VCVLDERCKSAPGDVSPPPTQSLLLHLHRGALFGYTFILFFITTRTRYRRKSPSRNTIYRIVYNIYVYNIRVFSLSLFTSFPRGRILVFSSFAPTSHSIVTATPQAELVFAFVKRTPRPRCFWESVCKHTHNYHLMFELCIIHVILPRRRTVNGIIIYYI